MNGFNFRSRKVVILALLVLFGFVLVFIIATKNSISITSSGYPLLSRGSVQVIGGDYYIFNGLEFYKRPVNDSSNVTVLSYGKKLPRPTNLVWVGDKGALMSFSGSFSNTDVDTYLETNNLPYEARFNSTWYYDFKSKALRFVSLESIYKNQGYFSASQGKVYYATSTDGEVSGVKTYDVNSGMTDIVNVFGFASDISSVKPCPKESKDVCIVASQNLKEKSSTIYRVTPDYSVTKQLTIDGVIMPSNSSDFYLALSSRDISGNDSEDSTQTAYKKGTVYDYASDTTISVPVALSSTSSVFGVVNRKPTIFDLNTNSYYSLDSSLFGKFFKKHTLKQSVSDVTLLKTDSQTSAIGVTFIDEHGQLWLASDKRSEGSNSSKNSTNYLAQCGGVKKVEVNGNTIQALFNDSSSLGQDIKQYDECAIKRPAVTSQYIISINTVDPKSGRFTSD